MTEQRVIETTSSPTDEPATRTVVVSEGPRSGVRTAVTLLAVLFFGALAVWGFMTVGDAEAAKDDAFASAADDISAAAEDVGAAAGQVGDAAEQVADEVAR